jgi:phosphoglycolate phosphatase
MKKKPLLCFDLDGTLIDSTEAHIKAYDYAFKKNNLTMPPKQKLRKLFGMERSIIIKKLFPNISPRKLKQVIEDHFEGQEQFMHLIKPTPHVVEALKKLKKHFTLGVVSNNQHETIMESLEAAKIPTRLFEVIVGEDDAKAKPAPDEILLAEKLTQANAKFMVGDTVFDIKAGKKANCKTIGVLTGIHDMETLMKAEPSMLASSVAILPDILINK